MLARRVRDYIAEKDLLAPGERVVVGISGGLDSVVLTHVLARMGFVPVAAHVNFGLRGQASEADEAFVRRWCAAQEPPVALHVAHRDAAARAADRGQSIQEAARDLRYHFLEALAEQEGAAAVAVAHHRDDQAETLLLRLFRGSGVEGLAGMPAARPLGAGVRLVRPLLGERRDAIGTYAWRHGLDWREDATNKHPKYQRGALRAAVLPVLDKHFGPDVTEQIARAADLVRDYVEATVHPALEERFAACAERQEAGGLVHLEALGAQPEVWRRRLLLEALRRWLPSAPQSMAVAREVEALVAAQVGRQVAFEAGRVWRERGHLRFVPAADAPAAPAAQTVACDETIDLPTGRLVVEAVAQRPEQLGGGDPWAEYVDLDALSFPLTVRAWEEGDRFQPLGMDHAKNVSDLLTDEKVPPHRRAAVLVVCSGDAIMWVVGHRLSAPARVTETTRHVGRLRFVPHAAA